MQRKYVWIILVAVVVLGLATMGSAQDSTGTGGGAAPIGNFAFIAGVAGLVLKAIVYMLERVPKIPNPVVAAFGGAVTAGIVWGLAAWFQLDYETVLGAVTTGGWIGSLGSTAAKASK